MRNHFNSTLFRFVLPALFAATIAIPSSAQTLTSLTPNTLSAGAATFALTVSGTGFVSASQVRWNGGNRATSYVSSTRLVATISFNDVAAVGTASITVTNPSPGGTSSGLTFAISSPASGTSAYGESSVLYIGS